MNNYLQLFTYVLLFSLVTSRTINNVANANEISSDLNDDVLGLMVFKSDLQNTPLLDSWNEDDTSPCSWKFIRCDSSGRVSTLSLTGLGLSGRLGKGLLKLQSLKTLTLSHNNLTGNINPQIITQMPNLKTLDLNHNKFSIQSSSLSNIDTSLIYLDLSHNRLTGPLNDDIFRTCTSLRYISLAKNSLTGPIPSTLSKCSLLNGLNLSNNIFSSNPFSPYIGGLWSLNRIRLLDISHNIFSGDIPKGIHTLHYLKELYLQSNRFSGLIPYDIGFCPHLHKLDLSSNYFTGEIPGSLTTVKSLIYLNLADNTLSGELTKWVGNLSNIQHLDVSNNVLTGNLPVSLGDLKSIRFLSLSNNKITGNLPSSLTYCSELKTLLLKNNLVNGIIPEELFSMGLEMLDLSGNTISGSIPPGTSRLFDSLRVLDMSRNGITDEIPPEIGFFSKLEYLNLSWNNLHSRIPVDIGYLSNLRVLDLRDTELYGVIPGELCDSASSRLSILQLDDNQLTGSIPDAIGKCSSLYLLTLSHNTLDGRIPNSLSTLKKLEILRIESNELSGEMPQELGTLQNLLAVNVSYNKLIGRLPTEGIFPSLDASALQGNVGLCSPLLKGPCTLNVQKPLTLDPNAFPNQMQVNSAITTTGHHRFLSISAIIALSAAAIIVVGVVVITLLNASARKRLAIIETALESIFSSSSRSMTPSIGRLVLFGSRSSGTLFTDPELLIDKGSEIGEGVFGSVYKASLGNEGVIVAIKKLIRSNILQYPEDFDREVRALGKVKHPNVVALKGYYWTPQLQLLVSDYAANGSLHFRIHKRPANMAPLSWATRFRIILGLAKGLAHLHHSCQPPITHYNLKPSNVLLDENYNAKISDFGLVQFLTKIGRNTTGNMFQGAPGYAAPELTCQSLKVDEKCDVYSFGIILLEILTGRRPIEYYEDNVVIINDHVRVLLEEGNVLECVDESIGQYNDEEFMPVLKLALVCTSQIPSSRPSMSEIVQILQVIKTPVHQTRGGY